MPTQTKTTQTTPHIDGLLAAVAIPRVSLEMQVDGYSLESQDFVLRALGEKNGFYLADVIQDDGYSGADFSRPSIQQALKLIREGKVQAIVWAYVDRFARDVEGGLALVKLFRSAGAKILIGQLGWYEDTPHYKLMLNNWLGMAQYLKDDIAVKSKAGVDRKIARGLAHGGNSPFGYRFVSGKELAERAKEKGEKESSRPQNIHEPVPADLATVRLIYDLTLQRKSITAICEELLSLGIKPPKSDMWHPRTVALILANPCYYTGVWHYGKSTQVEPKKRRPGSKRNKVRVTRVFRSQSEWKPQSLPEGPIMEEAYWRAVQDARAEMKRRHGGGGRPCKNNQVPMLRGVCRCRCGAAVTIINWHSPDGVHYRNYACNLREQPSGKRICVYRQRVNADELEGACWNRVMDTLERELPDMVSEYNEALMAECGGVEIGPLEAKDSWLSKKIADLAVKAVMADDDAVAQALQEKQRELKEEQVILRRRLALARNADATAKVDFASIRREVMAARNTKDPVRRQAIFQAWVESMVYCQREAEITLRVPVGTLNSKQHEHAVASLITLKTKVLVP